MLCIALLDHPLYRDVYDSVIVGFFAVLGIKAPKAEGNQCARLYKAVHYTTKLSAFVKLAQLLVVQRAVVATERAEVDQPANIIEVMQDLKDAKRTTLIQNALSEQGEVGAFLYAKLLEWLECLSLLDKLPRAIEALKTLRDATDVSSI